MSKRLQVVLPDAEIDQYIRSAESRGLTLSEWVRQALRSAGREVATGRIDAKLSAVRRAARHDFPTTTVETMLADIEDGYGTGFGP